jgi:ankyrin repeat protein
VKRLLQHGARVSEEAVFVAVAIPRGVEVLNLLAEHGADFNVHRKGLTPLMAATRSSSLETMRFLVARGADVRARSKSGYTAV